MRFLVINFRRDYAIVAVVVRSFQLISLESGLDYVNYDILHRLIRYPYPVLSSNLPLT